MLWKRTLPKTNVKTSKGAVFFLGKKRRGVRDDCDYRLSSKIAEGFLDSNKDNYSQGYLFDISRDSGFGLMFQDVAQIHCKKYKNSFDVVGASPLAEAVLGTFQPPL